MKYKSYFFAIINLLAFFSCSRNTSSFFVNPTLTGKWVLTKSCVCNACLNTIPFYKRQTLVFSSNGQAQVFTASGNAEQNYSGTYSVVQTSSGKILNMQVDSASPSIFYSIPGSLIISETGTTLVLNVIADNMTQCGNINTYAAVPN